WYERAFAIGGDDSPVARARGLFGATHIAEARGDEQLIDKFEEVVDALRVSGETRWQVLAMTHLALAYAYETGDKERAERLSAEALALARETGDLRGEAITISNVSHHLLLEGDEAGAEKSLEQAVGLLRELGDAYGVASCLCDLATLAFRRGDVETSIAE